jgi:hypothetical protein
MPSITGSRGFFYLEASMEDDSTRDVMELASKAITALQDKIAELQPAARFGNAVMDDGRYYSFNDAAKTLHDKDDPFVDAIMDYLNGLTDDNRRVEACYNIIKVCKGIANQLQQGS